MNYKEKLKDKRWKARRLEIILSANGKCELCGHSNINHLVVHHKEYISGLLAWEYENKYLMCLCKSCHFTVHKPMIFDRKLNNTRIGNIMSKIIKMMRSLNNVYKTNLKGGIGKKRIPKHFKSEDINLILLEMENRVEFDSLSIDVLYSEIKKIILEVREMDLVYYTDTMAVRLEELKLK